MKGTRTPLVESVQFTKPLRVDREKGVIYDAILLDWDSRNGYRYDPQAARRAVNRGLYESAKGYIDHPPKHNPRQERPCDAAFCRFANVRWTPEGVRGDIHFLPKHRLAQNICDDAELGRGMFGLSHNADGDQVMGPDGKTLIMEIFEVRSVDIVTRPATTTSLSESERPMRVKFKAVLESLSVDRRVPVKTRRALLEFMDDPGAAAAPGMEAELDAPPALEDPAAAMDHNSILHDGFKSAIVSLLDEGLDDKALMKRVQELLKAKAGLLGAPTAVDESEPEPEPNAEPALKESHRLLRNENQALKLLMESGITTAPAVLIRGLSLLESEQDQRKEIHGWKFDNKTPRQIPRSQPQGGTGGTPAKGNYKVVTKTA